MRDQKRERGIAPATPAIQTALQRYIEEHGEAATVEYFGLNRTTLARAALGLPLQGPTRHILAEGLGSSTFNNGVSR